MQRRSFPAVLCVLLAVGIVFAAVLGPLFTGIIRFHLPESLVNQYAGGEVVTLFIAAPAFMVSAWLWRRGDPLAPALAFGPAAYTVYTFVTAIVGQEYGTYDGNAERAFFLYVALIAGGAALTACAASELLVHDAPAPPDRLRKMVASIFLLIAAFFALAWTGQIAQVYRGDETTEYLEGPTLFWLIKMMDLGFLLPAMSVMGIGLLRRHPVAIRMAYGMISYAVCMAGAVLGMAVAMWLKDDPASNVAMIAFLTPITVGLGVLAVRLLSLYRKPGVFRERNVISPAPVGTGHAG